MRTVNAFVFVLSGVVSALADPFEVKNSRLDREWRVVAAAPQHQLIELRIGLVPQKGGESIEEHLLQISDPDNARWRQHLKPEEIESILAPQRTAADEVQRWLAAHGIDSHVQGNTVVGKTSVYHAESALNTTYSVYEHEYGHTALRTEKYFLPSHLHSIVSMVAPTTHFPSVRSQSFTQPARQSIEIRSESSAPKDAKIEAACGPADNYMVSPACYRAVYSIDWNATNPNTTLAILANVDVPNNQSDLDQYLSTYNPPAAKAHAAFTQLLGPYWEVDAQQDESDEVALDTQTSLGIAWPAKGVLIRTNTDGYLGDFGYANETLEDQGRDDFLSFLYEMAHNSTVPPVVSLSAGANEDYVPRGYAEHACRLMGAASARGVTWVFSSGDAGPIGCSRCNHNTAIDPQWPATCPWVLSVGATAQPHNETAMDGTSSGSSFTGGGFSNIFPRPKYQAAQVEQYINKHVDKAFQETPGFNASGRGYPDIAALGVNVPSVFQGELTTAQGTSASTPAWAAMIALLNDYEASRGKPTLGFVNPWLYKLQAQKSAAIRDITVCNGSSLAGIGLGSAFPLPTVGYNGSVGWDACTGLGVPAFNHLRASL